MSFSFVKVGTIGARSFFEFLHFYIFTWSTIKVAVEKDFCVVFLLVVVE